MRAGHLALALLLAGMMPASADDRLAEAERLTQAAQAVWGRDLAQIDLWLRQALSLRELALPPGDPAIPDTLGMLGRNAFNQGQMPHAEIWFRRQLTLEEQSRPTSFEAARALGDLGATLREQCQLPEAEQLVLRSLALRQALSMEGIAWWRAGSHDNLSKVHEMMGRIDDAITDTANASEAIADTGAPGTARRQQYGERLRCLRHLPEPGALPCWPTRCPAPVA